ncbi:hypothetical protein NOR_02411 [Metarhizium rileyi]|uniref:Uncharacterized protein n=1 Tax=Metarhizium rileyi (strain RCEF 4871) TaxID=1649241 RepID=A0A167HHJ2_METRR|nr:hypothetical protein NOR_02411 [Metarhizium rileyi RCEF 4871]
MVLADRRNRRRLPATFFNSPDILVFPRSIGCMSRKVCTLLGGWLGAWGGSFVILRTGAEHKQPLARPPRPRPRPPRPPSHSRPLFRACLSLVYFPLSFFVCPRCRVTVWRCSVLMRAKPPSIPYSQAIPSMGTAVVGKI